MLNFELQNPWEFHQFLILNFSFLIGVSRGTSAIFHFSLDSVGFPTFLC